VGGTTRGRPRVARHGRERRSTTTHVRNYTEETVDVRADDSGPCKEITCVSLYANDCEYGHTQRVTGTSKTNQDKKPLTVCIALTPCARVGSARAAGLS